MQMQSSHSLLFTIKIDCSQLMRSLNPLGPQWSRQDVSGKIQLEARDLSNRIFIIVWESQLTIFD